MGANMQTETFTTKDDLEGFLVQLDLMGGYIVHRIECRKGDYTVTYSKPEGEK